MEVFLKIVECVMGSNMYIGFTSISALTVVSITACPTYTYYIIYVCVYILKKDWHSNKQKINKKWCEKNVYKIL